MGARPGGVDRAPRRPPVQRRVSALRTWAQRIGRKWFFTIVVYFALFTIVTFIITLPLTYYEEFVRQHDYGLSNQTLQKWWTDSLTGLAVTCVAGAVFLWVPYLLLRKSPRRWWLYTAAAAIPFIVVANLVAPIWIAPLFNTFEPMHDKALEARILALADRAGIEGSRVFEVNKSVDTKTLNAYVAGVWQTKRIVLWDTIIARLDERELLFVMGHEMGHYVLAHVWQLVALSSLFILVLLYAAYKTMGAIVARWGGRFGFSDIADVASLPLLLLVTSVFSLAIAPAQLASDASSRARSGSLRPGDHTDESQRGNRVREIAAGGAGQSLAGTAVQVVARPPSAARRAHRVQQRLPPMARRRADALRGPIQEMTDGAFGFDAARNVAASLAMAARCLRIDRA